jgi:hypothetical protein
VGFDPSGSSSGGTCAEPLSIACGGQVSGDTTGRVNNFSTYPCSVWDESGPELIYTFALQAGSYYTVTATLSNMTADVDVFLLASDGCIGGQCLDSNAFGDSQASATNVPPGNYYVVVDGFSGQAGTFTLDLACTPSGNTGPFQIFLPLMLKNH